MNNDLISRSALTEQLKERLRCCNHGSICEATFGAVIGLVDAQPTIDAVPVVHGSWVEFWDEARGKRHGCSVCAASVAVQDDYCPHCGAKMDAPAQ